MTNHEMYKRIFQRVESISIKQDSFEFRNQLTNQ